MITLSTFKDRIDTTGEWAKRCARNHYYSLEYLRGIFDGQSRLILDLVTCLDESQYPQIIKSEDKDLIGYVDVFDFFYPIYLDDYGQCYYTKIEDKEHSFGTYNTEIIQELVSLVLSNMITKIWKEVERIYHEQS